MATHKNNDGYTEQGVTFPRQGAHEQLLREVYARAGVSPSDVAYMEAHGTGTAAGDPVECNAITNVFFKEVRTRAFHKLVINFIN